jgi:hypothetical protein
MGDSWRKAREAGNWTNGVTNTRFRSFCICKKNSLLQTGVRIEEKMQVFYATVENVTFMNTQTRYDKVCRMVFWWQYSWHHNSIWQMITKFHADESVGFFLVFHMWWYVRHWSADAAYKLIWSGSLIYLLKHYISLLVTLTILNTFTVMN